MVKKPSPKSAEFRKPPLPRKRPGPKPPSPEDARDFRYMMRLHPDLIELLDIQAAERGETRTRFIEKILVGFLRADPRNPRTDAAGRIQADAGASLSAVNDPIKFGTAWALMQSLNQAILNASIPDDWATAEGGYAVWASRALPTDPNKDVED